MEFVWGCGRHGPAGFQAFMQKMIYAHIPIPLASQAVVRLRAIADDAQAY